LAFWALPGHEKSADPKDRRHFRARAETRVI
jgi:hypothetical protein